MPKAMTEKQATEEFVRQFELLIKRVVEQRDRYWKKHIRELCDKCRTKERRT